MRRRRTSASRNGERVLATRSDTQARRYPFGAFRSAAAIEDVDTGELSAFADGRQGLELGGSSVTLVPAAQTAWASQAVE